jgi:hypothetical protein
MFMLLFAGCNNDHTAPCNNQWGKHAEVEFGEYAKDRVYIAKGMYIAKGKYIKYAKDVVYVAKGEYGKNAKEDASIKEGPTSLSPKKAMMNLLPRMATGLSATMSLSPQGQLAMHVMQDNDEPLATKGLRTVYAAQGNDGPLPQRVTGPQPSMIVKAPSTHGKIDHANHDPSSSQ